MTPSGQDPGAWDWLATHWEAFAGWVFGAGATWATFRSYGVRLDKLEKEGPEGLKRLEDKMDAHHTQVIGLMMGIASGRQQGQ